MKRLHLDEIEGVDVFDTLVWKPVRRTLGVTAFGINAYTAAAAGDQVVEGHDETKLGHEEVYVVVRGHATFVVDGEDLDAPAGTLVFLDDPRQHRAATAREPGTTVLAIGGVPGRHEVSAWEHFFPALPLMREGEWERARAIVAAGLEEAAGSPALLYNLACCEAQLGRRDDALEHLREAVEKDPSLASGTSADQDLATLRDDPAFPRGAP